MGRADALAHLLIEVLGLEDPKDLDLTYTAVGGDSLAAVHLVGRIRDDHGIDVPIGLFLEELPLRALIGRIEESAADNPLDLLLDEMESETPDA